MPTAQSSSSSKNIDNTRSIKSMHKKSDCEQHESTPSSNTGTKTPPEHPEFIKQTLIIIEKKVRNLDKRRQKLEEYKESQRKGTVLNEDQLLAVSKYEEVLRTLELSRELEKSFIGLANDTMKQQKKQAKKEQIEREEQMKEKLKETHKYLSVLDKFADEVVRTDFLNESNGAIKLSQQELDLLDAFYKYMTPCTPGAKLELASTEFAEHLVALMDGKNKPITALAAFAPITYLEMKKLFEKILTAPYWTEEPKKEVVEETEEVAPQAEETTPEPTAEEKQASEEQQTLETSVEALQISKPQVEQFGAQGEQVAYHNQSNEDFVIVSQSECTESLCQSKSPSLQPQSQQEYQQAQSKTFFTTLNQQDQQPHRNINEFINSCENNDEGLNFFQDSELQSRQQHEQIQQNEMGFQAQQGQQQLNNFNSNHESNHSDIQKDNHYKRGGAHRDHNGGNRQYQQNNRRYQDDRRNGNNNMQQQRNNNGERMPPRNQGNSAPQYDNEGGNFRGPRQNNGGYRGGANPGANGNRGGYREGGYRNQNGAGSNAPRNNTPRGNNYQRANNNQEFQAHNNQHSQMAWEYPIIDRWTEQMKAHELLKYVYYFHYSSSYYYSYYYHNSSSYYWNI